MRRKIIIKTLSAGIAAGFLALVKPESQPGMGVTAIIAIAFYLLNCRALSVIADQGKALLHDDNQRPVQAFQMGRHEGGRMRCRDD